MDLPCTSCGRGGPSDGGIGAEAPPKSRYRTALEPVTVFCLVRAFFAWLAYGPLGGTMTLYYGVLYISREVLAWSTLIAAGSTLFGHRWDNWADRTPNRTYYAAIAVYVACCLIEAMDRELFETTAGLVPHAVDLVRNVVSFAAATIVCLTETSLVTRNVAAALLSYLEAFGIEVKYFKRILVASRDMKTLDP